MTDSTDTEYLNQPHLSVNEQRKKNNSKRSNVLQIKRMSKNLNEIKKNSYNTKCIFFSSLIINFHVRMRKKIDQFNHKIIPHRV